MTAKPEEKSMTTPELFHVTSTITKFHGRKGVRIGWFNKDACPDMPFAELIEGYDELEPHFRPYLDQHHGSESVQATTRVEFPVPGNIVGYGVISVGGPQGFCLLCKEKEWILPFGVWGYYDLRQHEPEADTRGIELEL
jgi:hypothetical protein